MYVEGAVAEGRKKRFKDSLKVSLKSFDIDADSCGKLATGSPFLARSHHQGLPYFRVAEEEELPRCGENVGNAKPELPAPQLNCLPVHALHYMWDDPPCRDWLHQPSQDTWNPATKRLGTFVVLIDPDGLTTTLTP